MSKSLYATLGLIICACILSVATLGIWIATYARHSNSQRTILDTRLDTLTPSVVYDGMQDAAAQTSDAGQQAALARATLKAYWMLTATPASGAFVPSDANTVMSLYTVLPADPRDVPVANAFLSGDAVVAFSNSGGVGGGGVAWLPLRFTNSTVMFPLVASCPLQQLYCAELLDDGSAFAMLAGWSGRGQFLAVAVVSM